MNIRKHSIKHIQQGWRTNSVISVTFLVAALLLFALLPRTAFTEAAYASAGKVAVKLDNKQQSINLGPYLEFIEDVDGSLIKEDVLQDFKESDEKVKANFDDILNQGIGSSVYWLFVELETEDISANAIWFLELSFPLIRKIDFYLYSGDSLISSKQMDEKQRESGYFEHRNFIFDLKADGHETLYLLMRADSYSLAMFPLTLWKPEAIAKHNRFVEYWLGFYFGLMAAMLVFNSAVFFLVRDRSYLYNVLYIFSTMLFFGGLSGILKQYAWWDISFLNERLPLISAVLLSFFGLRFVVNFLNTIRYSKSLYYLANAFTVFLIVFAILSIIYPTALLQPFIFQLLLYELLVALLIYIAVKNSVRGGKIVMFAYLVLLVTIIMFILSAFGVTSFADEAELALYMGSSLNVLLITVGVASQLNEERVKRYEALIRENQAVQGLRKLQEQSTQDAMIDPLTSLPNRAALERFHKEYLEKNTGKKEAMAVLYLDLQSYYEVNHTLGFRSSDLFIEKAASRLNRLASEIQDVIPIRVSQQSVFHVVRLDSASFIILMRMRESKEKYVSEAQHLLSLLNRPLSVHDMMLDVKARLGIAFLPEHSTNIFTLVRFAQAAVEAKEDNSDLVVLYSSIVGQQASRKLKLVNDLRDAIKTDALYLKFQPQLDIHTNKIVSIEALLRWQHPEYGEVSPSEFIVLAEQTGLIHVLTDKVIAMAVQDLLWLMEKGIKLGLSINISTKDLLQENFENKLLGAIESSGLKPELFTLELTETALLNDIDYSVEVLRNLHGKGIVIAIDDFGAGHSSLAYIKQLPISEIKIDRAYVSQIDSLYSDRVITRSTINLAHEMGARVCAEGVETASSLSILTQFDCDLAQGFHIAKPMRRDELLVWLDESTFSS